MRIMILLITIQIVFHAAASNSSIEEILQGEYAVLAQERAIKVNASLSSDAEKLALLAERLFHSQGFIYTYEVASKALQLDPNNRRAKLYFALGELFEKQRGLLRRMLPLARQINSDAVISIGRIADSMPTAQRQFFLDGPQDIDTAEKFQDYFKSLRSSLQNISRILRGFGSELFLLNHYRVETIVYYNEDPWSGSTYEYRSRSSAFSACPVERIMELVYVFEPCQRDFGYWGPEARFSSEVIKTSMLVDELGVEGLRQIVNGMNFFTTLYTGVYSFDGMIEIARKMTTQGIDVSDVWRSRAAVELIKTQPEFLTLKDQSALDDMKMKGIEFLDALEWFQNDFSEFCGAGAGQRQNHLFGPSICHVTNLSTIIFRGRAALDGPINFDQERWTWDGYSETRRSEINLAAIFNGQLTDLKSYLPTRFDSCGYPVEISDGSIGGLFPLGDVVETYRFGHDPLFLAPRCDID